jgi:hypothetical protein
MNYLLPGTLGIFDFYQKFSFLIIVLIFRRTNFCTTGVCFMVFLVLKNVSLIYLLFLLVRFTQFADFYGTMDYTSVR